MNDDWRALSRARYLNLESFKRDGGAVRTPLWFAPDTDGTFYVYTVTQSAKVKRVRRTPACRVAACTMRGTVTGPWLDAQATIVEGTEAARGMDLLDRRYWPWKQIGGLVARLRGGGDRTVIAIRRK